MTKQFFLKTLVIMIFMLCSLTIVANDAKNKPVADSVNPNIDIHSKTPNTSVKTQKSKAKSSPRIYKLNPKEALKADTEVSFPADI